MKGKQEKKQFKAKKKLPIAKANETTTWNWKTTAFLVGIILLSLLVYIPVLHNTFLYWDDTYYIRDNSLIYSFNLKDIFSTNVMGNYHPVTILVLAIEYHFFGLSETGYHAVNLIIHLLNVVLVYYAVILLCERRAVALVGALLFGIHPIHVESVAWAAELKDLLYTFFFLASFIFYLKYQADKIKRYYGLAFVMFLFSLLSKGMGASLPMVLLLTDFFKGRKMNRKVWLEKIPFFILAIVFGVIAIAAQRDPNILQDYTIFTFPQRIAFACYGFLTYLAKLIVPVNRSAYYPYPLKIGSGIPFFYYLYIPAVLVLLGFTMYSLRFTKKVFFGIGFFALTIFLVLQLLPVGDAILADRYSYVPSIGIFYLGGEGFYFLWNKKFKWVGLTSLCVFTIFFTIVTNGRTHVWKNNRSLWSDVVGKYQTIPLAYYNLGLSFMDENKFNEALEYYTKAIELKPAYPEALVNRGNIFRTGNQYAAALVDYNKAIEARPNFSIAFFNRGIMFMNQRKNEEAIRDFTSAIEFNPGYYKAYSNRGVIYTNEKRYPEAIADYSKAIDLSPDYMEAYYNRGMAEFSAGNKEAACRDIRQSASLGFKIALDAIPQVCN
ncbi:MAG: tetratricopeptide repeat protein [Saprospiraceae bacterium]